MIERLYLYVQSLINKKRVLFCWYRHLYFNYASRAIFDRFVRIIEYVSCVSSRDSCHARYIAPMPLVSPSESEISAVIVDIHEGYRNKKQAFAFIYYFTRILLACARTCRREEKRVHASEPDRTRGFAYQSFSLCFLFSIDILYFYPQVERLIKVSNNREACPRAGGDESPECVIRRRWAWFDHH